MELNWQKWANSLRLDQRSCLRKPPYSRRSIAMPLASMAKAFSRTVAAFVSEKQPSLKRTYGFIQLAFFEERGLDQKLPV
jgi:hypothetical protein